MRQTLMVVVCLLAGLLLIGCASIQKEVKSQEADVKTVTVFHNTSSNDETIRLLVREYLERSKVDTSVIIKIRWLNSESEIARMMTAFEKGDAFAFVSMVDVNSPELRSYTPCHQTKKFVLLRN